MRVLRRADLGTIQSPTLSVSFKTSREVVAAVREVCHVRGADSVPQNE